MDENEFKAMLSVVMAGMLNAAKGRNNLGKACLSFTKHHVEKTEFNETDAISMLNEAIEDFNQAIEEVTVFRNMIRDDRPAHMKRRDKQKLSWMDDPPRTQQNPKKLIANIVRLMKN